MARGKPFSSPRHAESSQASTPPTPRPHTMLAFLAAAAVLLSTAQAQPFQPGQGLAPLGNLRTSDYDGPYNLTLLSAQANEVRAGGAARMYKGGSALRIPLCTSTSGTDCHRRGWLVHLLVDIGGMIAMNVREWLHWCWRLDRSGSDLEFP